MSDLIDLGLVVASGLFLLVVFVGVSVDRCLFIPRLICGGGLTNKSSRALVGGVRAGGLA